MRSERKRSELGLRAGAGAGAEGEGEGGQSMLEEGHRWQKSDFVGRYHLSRIAAKYPIPGKALAVDKVKAARVRAAAVPGRGDTALSLLLLTPYYNR